MATLLNNDFVVKAGLVVEGTAVASTSTSTPGSVQIASGVSIQKNLVVKTTSSFLGKIDAFGSVLFNSGLTVKGSITATEVFALVSTATNIKGGAPQSLLIQNSTGTTTFIPIGEPYQFLTVSAVGTATWINFSGAVVGFATTASNLKDGGPGQIPYQSSTGTTAFIATGTLGHVLISNGGVSAPQFTNNLPNLNAVIVSRLTVTNFTSLQSATVTALTATTINILNSLYVGSSTYIRGDLYVDGTQFAVDSDVLSSGNKILALSTGSQQLGRDFADGAGILIGSADASSAWASLTYGYNSNSWESTIAVLITTSTQATTTNSGALRVVGGVGIGGNLYSGGSVGIANTLTVSSVLSSTSSVYQNAVAVAGGVGIAKDLYVGGIANIVGQIPRLLANIGTFTSISVTGTGVALTVTNSVFIGNTLTVKSVVVTSTASSSTNTISNALYIAGGVGVGGTITAGDIFSNGVRVAVQASSVSSIAAGTDTAINTTTGQVTIWNTSTLQSVTDRGSLTTNTIAVNNITETFGTNTGALTVSGGVGLGGNLNVGGYVHVLSTASSTNFQSGALIVDGGVGVSGDLNVSGNIVLGGIFAADRFVGNLLGVASTASTVLTLNTTTDDPYYLTFVQNEFVNGGFPPPTGQILRTSTKFQIQAGSGRVKIGEDLGVDAQVGINVFNEANVPQNGLAIFGGSTTTLSDILISREDVPPNPEVFQGANITLVGESTVVIQEYNGSLLFFNDYQGGDPVNSMTLTGDNQLLINYQNPDAVSSATLSVNGGGYFVGEVTATSFTGVLNGVANTAGSVVIVSTTTDLQFYPTLVDENSETAVNKSLFTTSTLSINPSTGLVTINNDAPSTNTTTGALTVIGGVGIGGNLAVGGAVIATRIVSQTGTNANIVIDPDGLGDIIITTGTEVLIYSTATSTSTTTGALRITGGMGVGGTVYANSMVASNTGTRGNIHIGIRPPNINTGDIVYDGGSDQEFVFNNIGSSTGSTYFSNSGTVLLSIFNSGKILVNSTETSTSTTTGALVVNGGVGIGGNLNVGNTTTIYSRAVASSTNTGALIVYGGVGIGGALYVSTVSYIAGAQIVTTATVNEFISQGGVNTLNAGTDTAVSSSTGVITVWSTSTLQSITSRGSSSTNAILITNTQSSTSTNTGALRVSGGVGIGGNIAVGGAVITNNIVSQTGTNANIVIDPDGLGDVIFTTGTEVLIYSTATSTSTTTGALQIVGGVGVGGNIAVGGSVITSNIVSQTGTNANIVIDPDGFGDIIITTGTEVLIYSTATSTSPTSGALQVVGGVGVGGNVWVGSTASSTSTASLNAVYVAGGLGIAKGILAGGSSAITGDLKVTGNITATNVFANTITGTSGVFYGDNIGNGALYAGISSGYTYFPQTMIQASGNNNSYMEINVQNVHPGNQASTDIVASADSVTTSTSFIDMGITGSGWDGTQPYSFGKTLGPLDGYLLVAPGNSIGKGNLVIGTINTATSIKFLVAATNAQSALTTVTTASVVLVMNAANTTATSSTSGSVVVTGGMGISNNLYVGGAITATSIFVGSNAVLTSQTIGQYGVSSLNALTGTVTISAGTDTVADTNTFTNVVTVYTTSTLQSVTNRGSSTTNAISISNTTSSTSTNTGALVIKGGVGIAGDLYVGGTINANIVTLQYTTITTALVQTDDIINTYNTTASTSTNSGALTVSGGVGIGGAVWIGTTSYIANAQIITTATIGNFGVSKIIAGTDTAVSTSSGEVTVWSTSTLQTVSGRGSSTTNAISITNTASSTSTTTGALTVTGGVGIGGNLVVGGTIATNNVVSQIGTNANIVIDPDGLGDVIFTTGTEVLIYSTATSTSTITGALIVTGGVGIGGNIAVGGAVIANSIISQTGTNATIVIDPDGLGDVIFTTGTELLIYSTATSTSTITGAVRVTGGVGIGGNLYVASTSYIAGAQILTTASFANFGVSQITAGTDTAVTLISGAATIWNTSTLETVTGRGSSSTNAILITNTQSSTSTTTGALVVTGGVGIGGNLYVSNVSYVAGAQIVTTASIGTFAVTKITVGTDTAISTSTGDVTIWNTSTLQSITNRGSSSTNAILITNTQSSTSTTTGALVVTGGVGIGGTVNIGGLSTGTINAVTYGNTLLASYTSGVLTTTSSVTLDSFSTSTYRSAKYFCQVTSGTTSVHISEISAFHANGISYINEYGISVNNTILGVYDATIAGGNLNITFTPSTNTATTVKMTRLTLTI